MNGIFNINKPEGLTSHDVVARIRRLLRTRPIQNPSSKVQNRVGHAGTLDPLATGVLPIVVGTATRLVEYLADADKAYRATLVLGATTDTYDREGHLTFNQGVLMPSADAVGAAMQQFKGEIEQLPPMHSAIKMGGKKLYDLARQGIEVKREPRKVTIKRLEQEAYDPPRLQLYVECSKGTYIRSLAHDLGTSLGTGAYLEALVRTRHGPFTLEGAIGLESLEAAFNDGTWQASLYPPDYILADWLVHVTSPGEEKDLLQGKPLNLPPPVEQTTQRMAAKTQTGELLAVLHWDAEKEAWQPKKVFIPSSEQSERV
ncbi:MAG TPA: tRNA pseudouridine(55) synthase TruB [Chloroflexia bacterium]|nr:tRNA pseudouridine(55) synthase TruB [Chloroflexia bacterium]